MFSGYKSQRTKGHRKEGGGRKHSTEREKNKYLEAADQETQKQENEDTGTRTWGNHRTGETRNKRRSFLCFFSKKQRRLKKKVTNGGRKGRTEKPLETRLAPRASLDFTKRLPHSS